MNFCGNCGTDVSQETNARFCPNCGNSLAVEPEQIGLSESKDNSREILRGIKGNLLALITSRFDSLKITLRSAFKTRYSDYWSKEEAELTSVSDKLVRALKNDNQHEIEEGIRAMKSFLKIDSSGTSEKISSANLNSFLNSSNGRKYGSALNELLDMLGRLSDSSRPSPSIQSVYEEEASSDDHFDSSNEEVETSNLDYPASNDSQPNTDRNYSFDSDYNSFGIIFTNLNALANRLNCGREEVETIIVKYISQLEECGHQYILLDSSNNSYNKVSAEDGWQSHVELLKDFYNDNSQAEYLFIIGGHDVIPMAVVDNEPGCYQDDTDIETDMPYSYLVSDSFQEMLWGGELFRENVKLYCGRLPVPHDRTLNDVSSFLDRSARSISIGLDIDTCFGMTAKSWERASREIISHIAVSKKLYTSPEHDLDSAEEIFNSNAELYFFNLHGSDSPGSPEYFGDNSSVISPEYLIGTENSNFVMTEACYGAKYIDYTCEDSMLLASLYSNTVAFVGSSRVAFGASSEDISSADIIAKSYLENILLGETCGKAIAIARIDVFDACPDDEFEYGTTSAAEFNLFGDPVSSVSSPGQKRKFLSSKRTLSSKSFLKKRPEKKQLFVNEQKGMLNDIRNVVNQEMQKIRGVIDSELYAQYNIEPRGLSSVFEIKGRFGETSYNYNYYKKSAIGFKQVYAVFADKTGNIKSVIISK